VIIFEQPYSSCYCLKERPVYFSSVFDVSDTSSFVFDINVIVIQKFYFDVNCAWIKKSQK